MRRFLPLLALALVHMLVDAFAIVIEPLWPRLGEEFRLGTVGILWLMTLWAVTTSCSQVLFGYLRDRFGTPWLLLAGPLVTVGAISAIGLQPGAAMLFVLLLLGGLGIGAFHPEAAVTASSLQPENRTRALALFMCGGTLGLALGPVVSGNLVYYWGLPSLVWLAPPALVVVAALSWFSRRAARHRRRASQHLRADADAPSAAGLAEVFRGKAGYALLLLGTCAVRVVPSVGMGRALAYVLHGRGLGENVIGTTQSVFLLSGGVGMLFSAALLRRGWEKRAMIVCPLAGIPLVLLLAAPQLPYWALVALLVPTGLILTGTTPAMVSYGHQLLPRGRGLASSITMGLCWGIAGAVVAFLVTYFERVGNPTMTITAFAPFLAVAAIAATFLPDPTSAAQESHTLPAPESATVLRPKMAELQ